MAKHKDHKGAPVTEFDPGEHMEAWGIIKADAKQLRSDYSDRDALLDALMQFWDVEPPDLPPSQAPTAWAGMKSAQGDHDDFKVTIAPDGANRFIGAWRLLSATAPEFRLEMDENTREAMANASDLELAANRMWSISGMIRGQPLEKDAVLSAMWAAECHIGLENLTLLEKEMDDDTPLRIRDAVQRTPGMFSILNPRQGYARWDRWGLNAYLRVYETTVGQLKADWPGVHIPWTKGKKSSVKVTVWDWKDDDWRCVWIEGDSAPFYWYENDLGFIPVWVQITEGTQMFLEPHKRARPYMYTHFKSGMANRQNLAMTALFNNIEALAMSAIFKKMSPPGFEDRELQIKSHGPFKYFDLMQGEDLVPMMQKGAIDPALLTAIELAERKAGESTIYAQALGEPLGANAPFSMVALLHQAGRLPLVNPKTMTAWAIAGAMTLMFKWLKRTTKSLKVQAAMLDALEIDVDQIPDLIQFSTDLEIDLPQDLDANARVAGVLVKNGIATRGWARENLFKNMGQPDVMQEDIWAEQMADTFAQMTLQGFLQALQAQAQQGQQGAGGGGRGNDTSESREVSPGREVPEERRAPTPEGGTPAPAQRQPRGGQGA